MLHIYVSKLRSPLSLSIEPRAYVGRAARYTRARTKFANLFFALYSRGISRARLREAVAAFPVIANIRLYLSGPRWGEERENYGAGAVHAFFRMPLKLAAREVYCWPVRFLGFLN